MTPGQPAVGPDQHLPTRGPRGFCGAGPRGLWRVDNGAAFLPCRVHAGLGSTEEKLHGLLWGGQALPTYTPAVRKPLWGRLSLELRVLSPPLSRFPATRDQAQISSHPGPSCPWRGCPPARAQRAPPPARFCTLQPHLGSPSCHSAHFSQRVASPPPQNPQAGLL